METKVNEEERVDYLVLGMTNSYEIKKKPRILYNSLLVLLTLISYWLLPLLFILLSVIFSEFVGYHKEGFIQITTILQIVYMICITKFIWKKRD